MPYEEELEHSVFVNYVLNPRIDDEVLMKYREVIENTFSEEEKLCFRGESCIYLDRSR